MALRVYGILRSRGLRVPDEVSVAGYDNYDTMCASSSCLYGTGVVIPGFTILDFNNLVQSSDGSATSCDQCSTSADCASGETCNSAGICE